MNGGKQRWLVGGALLLLLAALRLPWLAADPGNWSFWSYSAFGTDEMSYTAGGRLALLTGRFLDPELHEPNTFVGSPGMHFLSYLGYRFAGLTASACRWPFAVLAITGWTAAYVALSRRTAPTVAAILIAVVSSNPYSLTFERVASNDVTVGALGILAFALCTARRAKWAGIGGIALGLALSAKATVLPLCPLICLAILAKRHQRKCRLLLLATGFGGSALALWAARELCMHEALGSVDVSSQLA